MQEQALKIVRSSEEFSRRGHFAGPEAVTQAYVVLEHSADYISRIGKRDESLETVIQFFTAAEQVPLELYYYKLFIPNLVIIHTTFQPICQKIKSPVTRHGYEEGQYM